MRTRKYIKQYLLMVFTALFAVSCYDHVPSENELPRPPVNFTYKIVDDNYQIDFYVYATVQFTNTSGLEGAATWDFGDGSAPVTTSERTITHNFQAAGLYQVRLTVQGQSRTHPIMINDIVPILTLVPSDDPEGIHEVLNTPVIIDARVPQPIAGITTTYTWYFPPGTFDHAGNPITTFAGRNPFENGGVTFDNVGSQQIRLRVRLFTEQNPGGRYLEWGVINVPIALNVPAPTVYFAVRNANVQALKIPAVPPPGVTINTFDMGVNSGRTPFNILFNDTEDGGQIFLLDAGRVFTFENVPGDAAGTTGGDGCIRVMSVDGMRVETFLINRGHAFNDPFAGFIHDGHLFFANRNRGVMRFPLDTRDRVLTYSSVNAPWFFANHTTGWSGRGIAYGAVNAGLLRIGEVWYWGKTTFNASAGIFRFRDRDIGVTAVAPADGFLLPGVPVRALMWDGTRGLLYFTTIGANPGVYRATIAELEAVTAPAGIVPFRLTMANGTTLPVITESNRGEGVAPFELIGISQLALDEATGNVYFGFRSDNPSAVPSGLMRVNHSTGFIEHVIEGIEGITAVTINNTPRRLF